MDKSSEYPKICRWVLTAAGGYHAVVNHAALDAPYFADVDTDGRWSVWFYDASDEVRIVARGKARDRTKGKARATDALFQHDESLKALLPAPDDTSYAGTTIPHKARSLVANTLRALAVLYSTLGALYLLWQVQPLAVVIIVGSIVLGLFALHMMLATLEFFSNRMAKLNKVNQPPQVSKPQPRAPSDLIKALATMANAPTRR